MTVSAKRGLNLSPAQMRMPIPAGLVVVTAPGGQPNPQQVVYPPVPISALTLMEVLGVLERRKVSDQLLRAELLESGALEDLVEAVLLGKLPTRDDRRQKFGLEPLDHRFTVDYSMSLAAMIAAGRYNVVDPSVDESNFPVSGSGKVIRVPQLVHLDRGLESEAVEEELNRRELVPGRVEELLGLGATRFGAQLKFPVPALGSTALIRGRRMVMVQGRDELGRRGIRLCDRDDGNWDPHCRFLAFPRAA